MSKRKILIGLVSVIGALWFCIEMYSAQKPEVSESHEMTTEKVLFDSIFVDLDKDKVDSKAGALDSIFNRMRRLTGLNGTVLYAERGRVIYENAFGYKRLRRKEPMQVSDTFQLASVSKMFAATAIMILQEEGKLNYDDTLQVYFPNFPYHGVTVRHLMNHRSGLPRYMSVAHENWEDKTKPMDNEEMLQLYNASHVTPYFKPGRGFHYCNTNYALLANVVEEVAGVPFDVFVRDKIFDKCGMDHSFVYQMRSDTVVSPYIEEGVPGFNIKYRRPRMVRNDYLNAVMGDKNVYSTVEDLFKFDQALKSGVLISQETQKEAYTPGYERARRNSLYGFGWRIRPERDSTVYHFGWWKGFRTFFIRDLAQDKTIIMLTNTDKGMGSDLLWRILDDHSFDLPPVSVIPQEEDPFVEHFTDIYKDKKEPKPEEEASLSTSS